MVNAPDCGSGIRGFDSRHSPHFFIIKNFRNDELSMNKKLLNLFFRRKNVKPIERTFISNKPEETFEIGRQIAQEYLKDFNLVLFKGDLGVGKTTLTKGILDFFNITKNTNSPTFALKNFYQSFQNGKQKIINHYDLYLIDELTLDQVASINEDLNDGIVIVEWSEKYPFNLDSDNKIIIIDMKIVNSNDVDDKGNNKVEIKIEVK